MAVRQDVATLGAGWNKTLLNYARAMGELDKLSLSDRNSWKFLGAIHGFDADLWANANLRKPTDRVPADLTNRTYGNQCQHGSWHFLPWHRGYLFAFEAIVAAKVKELTGDDWALPYWNYLDDTNADARKVPDAFLEDKLPDGSDNPLKKYPRRPGLKVLQPGPGEFNLSAMDEDDFLVGGTGNVGLGGGIRDFVLQGGRAGDLEYNPHNTVHRLVAGFMGDPRLAGLDPIFWLHHCNIDRLWEAWMNTPGKNMVRDPRWLNAPANRKFIMPTVGGADPGMTYTGADTLPGGRLQPRYDNLTKGTGVTPGAVVVARVGMGPPHQQRVEPIGANADIVRVGGAPAPTQVNLEPQATRAGVAAMGATARGQEVSRLYLALESIRGSEPSPLLNVYVNLPEGADPQAHPELLAGSISLFGLNVASQPDGDHGGNGLGFTLDITDLAQRLQQAGGFDANHLRVTLVPGEQISEDSPITVDKISVLKRTGVVT
jgi:tyrosinase